MFSVLNAFKFVAVFPVFERTIRTHEQKLDQSPILTLNYSVQLQHYSEINHYLRLYVEIYVIGYANSVCTILGQGRCSRFASRTFTQPQILWKHFQPFLGLSFLSGATFRPQVKFFKKRAIPGLFFVQFWSFSNKHQHYLM